MGLECAHKQKGTLRLTIIENQFAWLQNTSGVAFTLLGEGENKKKEMYFLHFKEFEKTQLAKRIPQTYNH